MQDPVALPMNSKKGSSLQAGTMRQKRSRKAKKRKMLATAKTRDQERYASHAWQQNYAWLCMHCAQLHAL